MVQVRVFISGFVQGVGYRYFVRRNAQKFNVNGWVRNVSDGRVEAVLQGDEKKVKELISLLHKGSMLSEVEQIVVDSEKVGESFQEFSIKETV